ncbi:MAG: hypothetical protein ABEJ30_08225 [Halorientalis sp.]
MSGRDTNGSETLEGKHERNLAQRRTAIREWAEYVRTHPDETWGEQVNMLVDAQLQSARASEDERPSPATFRESPLFE